MMCGFCKDFCTCIGGTITAILGSLFAVVVAIIALVIALVFGGLVAVGVAVIAAFVAVVSVIGAMISTICFVIGTILDAALGPMTATGTIFPVKTSLKTGPKKRSQFEIRINNEPYVIQFPTKSQN